MPSIQQMTLGRAVREYRFTLHAHGTEYEEKFARRMRGCGFLTNQLANVTAIQCRDKFYYAVFPGLFSGRVGVSGSLDWELQILRAALVEARRRTSDGEFDHTGQVGSLYDGIPTYEAVIQARRKGLPESSVLDAALQDPEASQSAPEAFQAPPELSLEDLATLPSSRLHSSLRRGLGFAWRAEVKYLRGVPHLSLNALTALNKPLTTLAQIDNLVFYDTLRLRATEHAKNPRLVKGDAPRKRPVPPKAERPVVNGRRARGRNWSSEEDQVLTMWLSHGMRASMKETRRLRRAQREHDCAEYERKRIVGELQPGDVPPELWDENKERNKDETEAWKFVLSKLPERTLHSIRARIHWLNTKKKKELSVEGTLLRENVSSYQKEMLGVRKMLPTKRRRLGDSTVEPFAPWTPEEDTAIYRHFKDYMKLNEETRRRDIVNALNGRRPFELILERAWVMKRAEVLVNEIPRIRQRPGHPGKAVLATRRAPLAIRDVGQSQTAPA